ncbi:MAG: polysaccharide deacetylase family protein, partial [Terriglobia bacterium]
MGNMETGRSQAVRLGLSLPLLILFLLFMESPARGYTPPGKITITFDVLNDHIYEEVRPVLSARGLTATVYAETGILRRQEPWAMTWGELNDLEDTHGWEIGAHTINHPFLTTVTDTVLEEELSQSKADLQAHGMAATTFATPYGDYDARVVAAAARHFRSHRAAWGGPNQFPFNDYEILAMEVTHLTPPDEVELWIDAAIQNNYWLVLLFHEVVRGAPGPFEYNLADFTDVADLISESGIGVTSIGQAVTADQPNLVPNGSFEQVTNGWADGWTRTDPQNVTVDTGQQGAWPTPANTLKISGGDFLNLAYSAKMPIDTGQIHLLKLYQQLKNHIGGGVAVYIDEFDRNGV